VRRFPKPRNPHECSYGHPYDEENTYVRADGTKGCRTCHRERMRRRRQVRAVPSLPPPAIRRALREAAGLFQVDVAEVIGVSDSTVSQWEGGWHRPRGARLSEYADLLDALGALLSEDAELLADDLRARAAG
jgi:DNA-binding transcriptional regulator YiaG